MGDTERDKLLFQIFDAIRSYNGSLVYSFKGGFILGNYICPEGSRYTTDIDLSIGDLSDFETIVDIVIPILDNWKEKGKIYGYKIREPISTGDRKRSGSINIYRKYNANSKAYIWTGLDISIHSMNYGVVRYKEGFNCYSVERILCDKIAAMYSDMSTILRRSRDLYDIFLLDTLNYSLSEDEINKGLKDRMIDIKSISTLEENLCNAENKIINGVDAVLSGEKVNVNWVRAYNINSGKVIKSVVRVLWMLREM